MNDLMCTGRSRLLFQNADDGGKLRLSWLRLLEKQINQFTQGESSSVPLETAGSLLRSILYTADLAENGVTGSEKEPEVLYREGRDVINRLFKKARRLSYLVQSTMLEIDSPCYREAVEVGIPSFFRAYDMEFAAQETPGDFDYPASIFCEQTGVTWMLHFLETLYWENMFCRRFPESFVEGTLKAHGIWGVAVPINVFEPIFAAALRRYLVENEKPSSLLVRASDNTRLVQALAPLTKEAVYLRVKEACKMLMNDMEIKSGSYRALLATQAEALARRLVPAVKHGNADGVFAPWVSPPPPVLVMDGDPLNDADFRTLHAELSSCRYFSDKLLLMRCQVHSLQDIAWLLDSGCFSAKEMNRLFSMLSKEELAALLRMGRGSILMMGQWTAPDTAALPEETPLWEKCLYGYLNSLGPVRRREITYIAAQMVT